MGPLMWVASVEFLLQSSLEEVFWVFEVHKSWFEALEVDKGWFWTLEVHKDSFGELEATWEGTRSLEERWWCTSKRLDLVSVQSKWMCIIVLYRCWFKWLRCLDARWSLDKALSCCWSPCLHVWAKKGLIWLSEVQRCPFKSRRSGFECMSCTFVRLSLEETPLIDWSVLEPKEGWFECLRCLHAHWSLERAQNWVIEVH